jgi:serine/threonine protein kinase
VALSSGTRVGPYEILEPIGAGGMGQVYKARDPRLGRDVAIKFANEHFTDRFEQEARAIAALNHPNICTLYDVGPNYLVTELVEGDTLRDLLRQGLSIEQTLHIAKQILEALGAAHDSGIVHRDLKPENVMVRPDGYVKVLDFGLAKRIATAAFASEKTANIGLSLPGQILGTIAYMSPEQILGQPTDPRSDLFAFGVILHEMLAGIHPWPRESPVDIMHAILHDDPPPIPDSCEEWTVPARKLLSKKPTERYASAQKVLEALAASGISRPTGSGRSLGIPQDPTSIAVLPFVFLNDIEERKALSLGFADALITVLGSLEDIRVLPTSAILNYSAGVDPAQVCRDVGVRHTLQGNVQKIGALWRVSIQIFDSTTHKISFSEKHDFKMENVFELQDEIGRRVVDSLKTRFSLAPPKSRERYSSEPEAYSEFMAGLRESHSDRAETLESAVRHLSKAIEHDPEFALAHAWLSYVLVNVYYTFDPQRGRLESAEYHCRTALTLDPSLPEGHLASAWILWSPAKNFAHAEAIAALEQVLAVRPNLEQAHNRMSTICLHIGRLEEARIANEHAQKSNPKTHASNLEFVYLYGGDFARAEESAQTWIREGRSTAYGFWFPPQPPLLRGDLELAEQRLTSALDRFPDEPLIVSLEGMLHARRGESGQALECVGKAVDCPRSFGHAHHTYYQVACIYAALGQTVKAMAWLERSVETGFACWPFFQIDPYLERLRGNAEFARLVTGIETKYKALKIGRL